jgi:hypothetical protein
MGCWARPAGSRYPGRVMPNRQLAVFSRGARWVLLDEGSAELGQFDTETDALAQASEIVRRRGEPRYVLIHDEDGWREALLAPQAAD